VAQAAIFVCFERLLASEIFSVILCSFSNAVSMKGIWLSKYGGGVAETSIVNGLSITLRGNKS